MLSFYFLSTLKTRETVNFTTIHWILWSRSTIWLISRLLDEMQRCKQLEVLLGFETSDKIVACRMRCYMSIDKIHCLTQNHTEAIHGCKKALNLAENNTPNFGFGGKHRKEKRRKKEKKISLYGSFFSTFFFSVVST